MAAMSYPEKFYAAVRASRVPATSSGFSDETRLVLRALRAQAELGTDANYMYHLRVSKVDMA